MNNEEKQIIEVEFNQEMINEDLELQKNGTEDDLVQDTFNEDSIDDMNDAETIIEVEE